MKREITTRQIFGRWHAYCGCGGYWSGEHDTEAEAIEWIKTAIARGDCQCATAAERGEG